MARQKEKESGRYDLGLIEDIKSSSLIKYLNKKIKKVLKSEFVKDILDYEPPLLAVMMFLGLALICCVLTLLYLIFFTLPIIGAIFICMGLIGFALYILAKKISTHKEDDDKYY